MLVMLILSTLVLLTVGKPFFVSGLTAFRHGSANMDSLIIMGTGTAYLYSVISLIYSIANDVRKPPVLFLDTGPMLFTFVAIGRWLEHVAKGRTSAALSKLMKLQPNDAIVVSQHGEADEMEQRINTQLLQRGDVLRVVPGAQVSARARRPSCTGWPLPLMAPATVPQQRGSTEASRLALPMPLYHGVMWRGRDHPRRR